MHWWPYTAGPSEATAEQDDSMSLSIIHQKGSNCLRFNVHRGAIFFFDHEVGPEPQRQSRSQFVGLRGTLDGPVLQRTVPPTLPNLHVWCCISAQRLSGSKIRGLELIVRYPRKLTARLFKKRR